MEAIIALSYVLVFVSILMGVIYLYKIYKEYNEMRNIDDLKFESECYGRILQAIVMADEADDKDAMRKISEALRENSVKRTRHYDEYPPKRLGMELQSNSYLNETANLNP